MRLFNIVEYTLSHQYIKQFDGGQILPIRSQGRIRVRAMITNMTPSDSPILISSHLVISVPPNSSKDIPVSHRSSSIPRRIWGRNELDSSSRASPDVIQLRIKLCLNVFLPFLSSNALLGEYDPSKPGGLHKPEPVQGHLDALLNVAAHSEPFRYAFV